MPFRGRVIEPHVPTKQERNCRSVEEIGILSQDIRRAESLDEQIDLHKQRQEVLRAYNRRNGLLQEERPGLLFRIGKAAVGWTKSIPERLVHPG
jgi:hypothetical protein